MRVKCKNIYNERTKKFEDKNSWLTIGKEYTVLEVRVYSQDKILYRMVGDNANKMPALYAVSQFDVIDGRVPTNWKIKQPKDDILVMGPEIWQEPGFWDNCYDADPKALEIYRREAKIIFDEAGEKF